MDLDPEKLSTHGKETARYKKYSWVWLEARKEERQVRGRTDRSPAAVEKNVRAFLQKQVPSLALDYKHGLHQSSST